MARWEKVAAIAACAGVGVTAVVGYLGYESTQRQIEALRLSSTPQLTANDVSVNVWDTEAGTWLGERIGELSVDDFDEQVWVIIDLANLGGVIGTIEAVGLVLQDGQEADELYRFERRCPIESTGGDKLADCPTDIPIEPQSQETFYIRLDDRVSALTCNSFVEERGIIAGAKIVGLEEPITFDTNVKVPFSDDCPALPETSQ